MTGAARLAESLSESQGDFATTLEEWEPAQLDRHLEERGKELGNRSQFGEG